MALTNKKRRFVTAIRSGLSGKRAAIEAGYSENGAPQAASRLLKDPDIIAAIGRLEAFEEVKEAKKAEGKQINMGPVAKMFDDPKEFLLSVMNNELEEPKLRVDAAKALLPYEYDKKSSATKKEKAVEEAQELISGRLTPKAPPKLVVSNG